MKATNMLLAFFMIFLITEISFPYAGYQGDWRWRNDDGDVYTATWKDSLNFPAVIPSNYEDNIRLRVKFLYQSLVSENISLRYSERPGDAPWIPINNVDTGKFFISQSSYLTDTMSYFDNQLLPPDSDYSYLRTITFDSSYNYNLIDSNYWAYELEYSLKTAPDLEPGTAYFFSLFSDQDSISLGGLKEYPVLMISPVNWNTQHSGTTENLSGASFVDGNNGWIVGTNGTILHTSDGGSNWILNQNVTTENLSGVSFIDENNGWIVGSNGTILHTTNGGDPWIPESSGTMYYLTSVCFIDENTGWIVGAQGTVLHTTNGGNNWTTQSSNTTYPLLSVCFIDANNGVAVGGAHLIGGIQRGYFCRTTNGGSTWSYEEVNIYLNAVSFGDAKNGTAVGGTYVEDIDNPNGGFDESTAIYRTTDGGETWTYQTPITSRALQDVYFTDSNNGWAVGWGGTILKTTDGGVTWDFQTSPTTTDLNAVSFADANNGLVVGNAGKILGTANGGVPVELTSFTALANGNNVLLNWSTATEINNQGFEVQRSSGNSEYTGIGFVEGNGSTTEKHSYSYTDKKLNSGKYYYRLKQIDFDGSYEFSDVVEVTVSAPNEFSLQQNYPNPFNPATTIKYSIPEKSYVTLKIYDILGAEIETLINDEKRAGNYEINWNAVSAAGGLPSGIYFYQLKAGPYIETKKMILMK